MDYLPIFFDMRSRRAVVIGGGAAAARKVGLLLKAGAQVKVVAPQLTAELDLLASQRAVLHLVRDFEPADLSGCALAIAATGDVQIDSRVSLAAREAGIPVNVVDSPELCSFILPSVVDRSPVTIAISSGGKAPILARLLRAQIEALVPPAFGRLAALAGAFRARVKRRLLDPVARRRFWEDALQGAVAERLFVQGEPSAHRAMEAALDAAAIGRAPRGEVYLVGAGPGDPDLLTLRALRVLQQADVILHDRLVAPAVVDLARQDAERIDVGKRCGRHSMKQYEINRLMIRLALEGKRVVRLKGGDPLIFGRGGEELEALHAHGIPFQIVPGITAATGCAAYAGIPLTHRGHAQACTFVTGHSESGELDLDWAALARPRQTLVVYMGLGTLDELSRKLMAHGARPDTPAAVIENGTRTDQHVVMSTLESIATEAARTRITGPALIVIGTVVGLRERLSWFGRAAGAGFDAVHLAAEAEQP
jgi:uroporphyrin-III C-methyltransferase/precorrin-2 dehydrogenase/sirohydrochlorin ferrochelatase